MENYLEFLMEPWRNAPKCLRTSFARKISWPLVQAIDRHLSLVLYRVYEFECSLYAHWTLFSEQSYEKRFKLKIQDLETIWRCTRKRWSLVLLVIRLILVDNFAMISYLRQSDEFLWTFYKVLNLARGGHSSFSIAKKLLIQDFWLVPVKERAFWLASTRKMLRHPLSASRLRSSVASGQPAFTIHIAGRSEIPSYAEKQPSDWQTNYRTLFSEWSLPSMKSVHIWSAHGKLKIHSTSKFWYFKIQFSVNNNRANGETLWKRVRQYRIKPDSGSQSEALVKINIY